MATLKLGTLAAASLLLLFCTSAAAQLTDQGLVRVAGGLTTGKNGGGVGFQANFADRKCRRFFMSGWNSWEVVDAAYGTSGSLPDDGKTPEKGRELLDYVFDQAVGAKMNTMRFFAVGWGGEMQIQTAPGVYNEDALVALDWVIHEAGDKEIKLVLTLVDGREEYDSRLLYTEPAGKKPIDFFTDDVIKGQFKDHLQYLLYRRNTFNGILYRNDPAIFAWDLINQPGCGCNIAEGGREGGDCSVTCGEGINAWIPEMAEAVKEYDPHHMVLVGEQGFYSSESNKTWANPDAFFDGGKPWAVRYGQDFINNNVSPALDYVTIQLLTDDWGLPTRWFQDVWLREHIEDAWTIGKPLVIEEFGKLMYDPVSRDVRSVRDPFLEQVYAAFLASARETGPLQGVSFWELDAGAPAGKPRVPYGVRPGDTTWTQLVSTYSASLLRTTYQLPLASYCVPGELRSMDAVFYTDVVGEGADVADDDDVYYMTYGANLDCTYPGRAVGKTETGFDAFGCMEECEGVRGCVAFRYNPAENGTCIFYEEASREYMWSPEGWEIFYKEKAYRNCYDSGCKYCDHEDICIKCEVGDLYYDKTNDRPFCPGTTS